LIVLERPPKKNKAEKGKQERVKKRNGIHYTAYFVSTLLSSRKWRQMRSNNSWDSWIDSCTVSKAKPTLQFTSTFKSCFQCQKWHLQLPLSIKVCYKHCNNFKISCIKVFTAYLYVFKLWLFVSFKNLIPSKPLHKFVLFCKGIQIRLKMYKLRQIEKIDKMFFDVSSSTSPSIVLFNITIMRTIHIINTEHVTL